MDPLNLIKQCPNCKEVWIKVTGCDGSTFCGNRAGNDDDSSVFRFKAYAKYIRTIPAGYFVLNPTRD